MVSRAGNRPVNCKKSAQEIQQLVDTLQARLKYFSSIMQPNIHTLVKLTKRYKIYLSFTSQLRKWRSQLSNSLTCDQP